MEDNPAKLSLSEFVENCRLMIEEGLFEEYVFIALENNPYLIHELDNSKLNLLQKFLLIRFPIEGVEVLLEKGVDPDYRANEDKLCARHLAYRLYLEEYLRDDKTFEGLDLVRRYKELLFPDALKEKRHLWFLELYDKRYSRPEMEVILQNRGIRYSRSEEICDLIFKVYRSDHQV
jgi:hypothetical protein